MRFGQFLLDNMVSEWRLFYINYQKLKKLLKTFKKNFRYKTHKTLKENNLMSFKLLDIFISPKDDINVLLEIIISLNVSPSEEKVGTPFKLHSFPPLRE